MSVYVDQLIRPKPYYKSKNERWGWSQSCHMIADTENELHEFARRLGLRREWFQNRHSNPRLWHYDLTASKRQQALCLGAKEITPEQFAKHIGPKPGNQENDHE
jgi:hypothetical protein